MKPRITVKLSDLPLAVELRDGNTRESYVLKPAGKKKFGMQLVKPDSRKTNAHRRA